MPLITSIPPELMHEILSHIQLEDLENFAQISRRIYTIAGPVLSKHRALCCEFRTFICHNDPTRLKARLEREKRVHEDPLMDRYVRTVKVSGIHRRERKSFFRDPGLTREHLNRIRQLPEQVGLSNLRQLHSITDTPLVPSSDLIRRFSEQVLLTCLLMQFPNVTSVKMEPEDLDFGLSTSSSAF